MEKLGFDSRTSGTSAAASVEISQSWLSADGKTLVRRAAGAPAAAPFEAAATSMAMAQGGGLMQTAFMMWMMGSSVSIWTIFFLSTMIMTPFKALFSIEQSESCLGPGA